MTVLRLSPIDLASDGGRNLLAAVAAEGGGKLAAFAARTKRLFTIVSPLAPGVRFVGGEVANGSAEGTAFSLAGTGHRLETAMLSCLGEGIERLSQVELAGDIGATAPFTRVNQAGLRVSYQVGALIDDMVSAETISAASQNVDWLSGKDLASNNTVWVPADWCLRRAIAGPLRMPDTALSTGAAAGPTVEAAAVRAVLELVERDAAALWWLGGRRGRPLAMESDAVGSTARLIGEVRQGRMGRTSWLLDITTDLDIPVVAAISVDATGKALACGMAARFALQDAARAATFEMCQMELATLLVELKRRQRGEAALNTVDRQQLVLATAIDANHCDMLFPIGTPRTAPDCAAIHDREAFQRLQSNFAARDIEVILTYLTRPEYGVPFVVATAPALQRMPSAVQTQRLRQCIAATGGAASATGSVRLM